MFPVLVRLQFGHMHQCVRDSPGFSNLLIRLTRETQIERERGWKGGRSGWRGWRETPCSDRTPLRSNRRLWHTPTYTHAPALETCLVQKQWSFSINILFFNVPVWCQDNQKWSRKAKQAFYSSLTDPKRLFHIHAAVACAIIYRLLQFKQIGCLFSSRTWFSVIILMDKSETQLWTL